MEITKTSAAAFVMRYVHYGQEFVEKLDCKLDLEKIYEEVSYWIDYYVGSNVNPDELHKEFIEKFDIDNIIVADVDGQDISIGEKFNMGNHIFRQLTENVDEFKKAFHFDHSFVKENIHSMFHYMFYEDRLTLRDAVNRYERDKKKKEKDEKEKARLLSYRGRKKYYVLLGAPEESVVMYADNEKDIYLLVELEYGPKRDVKEIVDGSRKGVVVPRKIPKTRTMALTLSDGISSITVKAKIQTNDKGYVIEEAVKAYVEDTYKGKFRLVSYTEYKQYEGLYNCKGVIRGDIVDKRATNFIKHHTRSRHRIGF